MKNKKLKRPSSKKKFIVLAVLLLILGGASIFYVKSRSDSKDWTDTPAYQPSETVNLAPATDEDKQQGSDEKTESAGGSNQGDSTDSSKPNTNLTVTITSADAATVRAQVSGVVEDGGTCTATYTQGTKTYSKTSSGIANVSDTQCEPIRPDAGKLTSGTWKVVVKYSSSKGSGTSAERTITV